MTCVFHLFHVIIVCKGGSYFYYKVIYQSGTFKVVISFVCECPCDILVGLLNSSCVVLTQKCVFVLKVGTCLYK